jgi:ABC-2 type transport system permease protein
MNLWKLEWLRLVRTKNWLILTAVFIAFGLIGPFSARYMAEIIGLAGGEMEGVTIEFPDPVPADGMIQYVSNAIQVGTLVAVIVAAGALAFDAIAEMGVFLRTRVSSVWRILVPRLVVPFSAIAAAYVLGVLAAWYETWALLGPLPAGRVIVGAALGVLFLGFAVAVVAAVAQWTRGTLATVMVSLGFLLTLPIVGIVDVIGQCLPTRLGSALSDLVGEGSMGDYLGPTAVTVLAIPALLWLAVQGARRREA